MLSAPTSSGMNSCPGWSAWSGWRAIASPSLAPGPTPRGCFEDCRVPVFNRLGEEGIGFKIAMAGLDGGRLNIGACSLGGAQSALDKALAYMKQRKAFGKRLDEFQALQFRLADMATGLEASRAFLWRAAAAFDRKEADATMLCAMAKRFGTVVGFEVATHALDR